MGNAKPFASLSSGLLARKGQAKPAMRPQGFLGMSPVPTDDLGWNDMGYDAGYDGHPPMEAVAAPVQAEVPQVVRQREMLGERFPAEPVEEAPVAAATMPESVVEPAFEPIVEVAAPVAVRPVSDGTLKRLGRETKAKKGAKAAFTLRLDTERHLRLRLASAVTNRSAQNIVSDALDAYLGELTELDGLVERVPGRRVR
ncbi:hypothetical protein [Sphingomonas sp. AX6]|uniref:hypothetical protein n=1 Tax=Sphingomonas sp. AX6 TaxID=2653171 RepID=UPI00135B5793|nr:hypothetical protein [Sphingomonas sp. AX6]